jgi:hypothetical protein
VATYQQGHWVDGVKVAGKACQWKASEKLMGMLKEEEQREEGTSLAGTCQATRLVQIVESLVMLPFDQTIRPVDVTPTLFVHPTERELRLAMGLAA